ncbi:MAG: peptide chain release factor N(5)-glutamine methyltransferase [Chlamydiales bacterium]
MNLQNHLLNIFTNKNSLVEIVQAAEFFLAREGIALPRREAEEVIAHALKIHWADLYLNHRRPFQKEELNLIEKMLIRRGRREPMAYIMGKVKFAGLIFDVSPDVLVPRPETEILVETISRTLETLETRGKVLWDICCGSGCVGIALKSRFPDLTVILSDISEKALAVAKKNAAQNQVDVQFKQGDLLIPFAGENCDFFTCNPPYISEKELDMLSPEVIDYEPKMALIAGKTGLEYYERLAKELHSGERGWFEMGHHQGTTIQALFKAAGWSCEVESDWAGQDRFVYLHRSDFTLK